MIDSPGLLQANHQLYLSLVTGQVRNPAQISDIVVKTTPAGVPVRVGDVAAVEAGVKPVYTIVTANGQPAVLLSVNRQPDSNTVRGCRRSACRSGGHPPVVAARGAVAAVLRPVDHRDRVHQERARRDHPRTDSRLSRHGAVPAGLGNLARCWAGDSRYHSGHLYCPEGHRAKVSIS